ncbi:unnamed protein product [Brassica oleracea]|uniref:Uncharacterized protein n=1 Tax=Brassica oleracea TaxID=3712 RepID=A0A3P6GP99_BRAOL|nr:unnamed protein product [Brassica oleracea]
MDMFQVKALHHEGFGLECVQYAIFDDPTYEWVVISRQPNIIGKLRFCSTSRCMHMVLAVVCLMREGEKDIGQFTPVHWDKDEWNPLQAAWHVIQPELKPCNLIMSLMNLQAVSGRKKTLSYTMHQRSLWKKEHLRQNNMLAHTFLEWK